MYFFIGWCSTHAAKLSWRLRLDVTDTALLVRAKKLCFGVVALQGPAPPGRFGARSPGGAGLPKSPARRAGRGMPWHSQCILVVVLWSQANAVKRGGFTPRVLNIGFYGSSLARASDFPPAHPGTAYGRVPGAAPARGHGHAAFLVGGACGPILVCSPLVLGEPSAMGW